MSHFLLAVRDGIPSVLKNVGETWDESVAKATEILTSQSLYEGVPKIKDDPLDESFNEYFGEGYFETTDPNVTIYFICDE